MIHNIVVAIDGSENADQALRLAADLAARYQARLAILHVLLVGHIPEGLRHMSDLLGGHGPEITAGREGVSDELPRQVRLDIAERLLSQAGDAARAQGAPSVESAWKDGPTINCILDYASAQQADTIVMGSRGLSELKGLVVGSVSNKIAQLFKGNIITVR